MNTPKTHKTHFCLIDSTSSERCGFTNERNRSTAPHIFAQKAIMNALKSHKSHFCPIANTSSERCGFTNERNRSTASHIFAQKAIMNAPKSHKSHFCPIANTSSEKMIWQQYGLMVRKKGNGKNAMKIWANKVQRAAMVIQKRD